MISNNKRINVFFIILLFVCCKNSRNVNDKIYSILNEEGCFSQQIEKMYIIQDNSCMYCFDELEINLKTDKESNTHSALLYLSNSNQKNSNDLSFLDIDFDNNLFFSNNKELKTLLLEAVGGFSKGLYLIENFNNSEITIRTLQ